jgi:hypothetical protein
VAVPAVTPLMPEMVQTPPELRGQVVPEVKLVVPVPADCDHVIVSPLTGAVKPDSVAVQEEVRLTTSGVGEHVTVTVGAGLTEMAVVPVLPMLGVASPG